MKLNGFKKHMIFEENTKAIYLQIADRIADDIMHGVYDDDARIPSVREYAASVEVNANTVMRSYERLAQRGLIFNRRGIGFFVSPDAKMKIMAERGEELMANRLPPLFNLMHCLGITPRQLKDAYEEYINQKDRQI